MNKILVRIHKDKIVFSKYNRDISEPNMNNTNVINVKDLKFTDEYIEENLDLLASFIRVILIKSNINKVYIKDISIAETTLKLINKIDLIKHIILEEDKPLNYTLSALLLENNNIESIECYSLPDIMYHKFDNVVRTRSKLLSSSNFLKENNITTYSDLCNKERIKINENLYQEDVDDIIYFLKNNIKLKKIELLKYSLNNLKAIIYYLNANKLRHVTIVIHENSDTTEDILKDIKFFEKINKSKNINIKIKYSKEYKEKNGIKEFNIIMLKNILITIFISGLLIIGIYKIVISNNTANIKETLEEIEEENNSNAVSNDDDSETYEENTQTADTRAYQKDYNKTYKELLKINSDTVGWLKVNNTNIDFPIVQTKDNEYYMNHAFDKSKNNIGWAFVDYRNTLSNLNQNTIIYAHSMAADGLMFTTLKNVLKESWYNNTSNLTISFSIKGVEYKWKIFSIYTIPDTNDYLYIDFNTTTDFINFANKIKNRSIKDFGVEIKSDDNILTLSTCYKSDKQKLVVHAKLIK